MRTLDKQIAQNPDVMKFKIDRANLLCSSGEYYRAKSEYIDLLPLSASNEHFKFKIKNGLTTCESAINQFTRRP